MFRRLALAASALLIGVAVADAQAVTPLNSLYFSGGSPPTGYTSQPFQFFCTAGQAQCWPLLQIYDGTTRATVNAGDSGLTTHIAGGSIGNTSFGISGTLPAFAATPTFNVGTMAPLVAGSATIGKADLLGNAGATMDVAQGGASAATNALQIAGVYDSTPPTLTNGQGAALLLDASGRLIVNVGAGGGSGGTSSSFSATFPSTGTAAGAEYLSSPPTLTTGQMVPFQTDVNGNLLTIVKNTNANGQAVMASSAPVVIASDQAAVATKAAASSYAAGSLVDVTNLTGSKGAGTAAADSLLAGAIYNSSPITLTTGQQAALQADANGYLNVHIQAGAGSGGTASNFGSAFPTAGTAIGLTNGTNMVAWSATSNYGTAPSAIAVPAVNAAVTNSLTVGTLPSLVAGSAIIGKTGIDQTTNGTTNGVYTLPNTAALGGDPCTFATKTNAAIGTAGATNVQIVGGTASKKVYLCSIHLTLGAAAHVSVIEGTGAACTTANEAAVFGSTTAANGESIAANGGYAYGNGAGTIGATATAANGLCVLTDTSVQFAGNATYVIQ